MTDRELLLDACYAYEALAGLGGLTDRHKEAYKKLRDRIEQPECCPRCGEVNPADIHTCTPMTVKDIQISDKNA